MEKNPRKGTIFNIQRYSIHDGTGIRTLIFLKGCPLECIWCANPEGQHFQPALQFLERKCVGCQRCAAVCREEAILKSETGIIWDRERCTECFACADTCLFKAREICGKEYSVDEIMEIAVRDSAYYRKSGGGVTLSGGEPLCQVDFAEALLQRLQQTGIHTAIETCGYYPWSYMERVLPYLNMLYMDLKILDPDKHEQFTGKTNEVILENIQRTAQSLDPARQQLIIRTPVIPGINDTAAEIENMAMFIKRLGTVKRYELLPYHNYGAAKWERTKWTSAYALSSLEPMQEESIRPLKEIVADCGLETNFK